MSTPVASTQPRLPTWGWDVLASLFALFAAVARVPGMEWDRSPVAWAAALVPVALVPLRRRWPWAVLAGCLACYAVQAITAPMSPFSPIPTAIAIYSIAVQHERRTTIIAALATGLGLVGMTAVASGEPLALITFQILVTIGFSAALGDAARTRRAYIAEITERATRAEQTREAEASRRVAEDRLRIARDLHDVVAHQISVISLNAGVATSALDASPERAREALATIREASRRVLREIGDLLTTLRLPGDAPDLAPSAGFAQVEALLASFEESGLHATVRVEGSLEDLPPAVDLVAYRVVQEALTNALKHSAAGRVHLLVTRTPERLTVVATNAVHARPSATESRGYGLTGMRERVASVRGSMKTDLEGGQFRLEVVLPIGGAM